MQHNAARCSFARRHDATTRSPCDYYRYKSDGVQALLRNWRAWVDRAERSADSGRSICRGVASPCSRCGNYTDAAAASRLLDRGFSRRRTIADSSPYSNASEQAEIIVKSLVNRTVNDGGTVWINFTQEEKEGRRGPVYCESEALAHFAVGILRTLKSRETRTWNCRVKNGTSRLKSEHSLTLGYASGFVGLNAGFFLEQFKLFKEIDIPLSLWGFYCLGSILNSREKIVNFFRQNRLILELN